ncbi:MAG: DUF4872 domain-containing protein [Myxococcales bacterium]|nr:DUF4872 domain-containing protein [Myxococcales bacterium]
MRAWGVDAATWGLRALLEDAGLKGPEGAAPSEALALVLGGGIGFGSVAAGPNSPVRWFVSGRHAWHADFAFIKAACERIGLDIALFEAEDAGVSAMILSQWMKVKAPCVLAWVDAAMLPWHSLPTEWRGLAARVVVLRGTAPDGLLVEDLNREFRLLRHADAIAARAVQPRHRGRLIRVNQATRPIEQGIRPGLAACVQGLRARHGDVMGHSGLRNWASYLVRADAFLDRFTSPPDVLDALLDLYRAIHSQGAMMRALFADGIREASALLMDEQLREHARVWGEIARDWNLLASRCVPDEPQMASLQHVAMQMDRGVGAGDSAERIGDLRARFSELRGEIALNWLPEPVWLNAHLASLGQGLLEIAQREDTAVDELQGWLSQS